MLVLMYGICSKAKIIAINIFCCHAQGKLKSEWLAIVMYGFFEMTEG